MSEAVVVVRFHNENDEELWIEFLANGDGSGHVDRLILTRVLHVTCEIEDWTLNKKQQRMVSDY